MTNLTIPNTFTSGTTAVSARVNANFDAIEDLVNNVGVPKVQPDAVTADALEVSQRWEPGDLKWSARQNPSTGWARCDGSAVPRTGATAALFNAIGTAYGAGDGLNTFNLPPADGRTLVASGTGSGLSARARGDKYGVEAVQLTSAESGRPAATPTLNDPGHFHTPSGASQFVATGGSPIWATAPGSNIGTSGSTTQVTTGITANAIPAVDAASAHTNVQPSLVGSLFIKL